MKAHPIPENLSLFLSTRQKRLNYFRGAFDPSSLKAHEAKEIQEMLHTYALLMSKYSKATASIEQVELEERILSTDRQLTSLFEKRRLFTSRLRPTGRYSTQVNKPRTAPAADNH